MASPGFRVTAQQHGFISPGKDEFRPERGIALHALKDTKDRRRLESAGARIHPDGKIAFAAREQLFQHREGGIIDRLIREIFQGAENRGMPRPGKAAYQHDPAPFRRAHRAKTPATWLTRPSAQSRAKTTRCGAEAARGSIRTNGRSNSLWRAGIGKRASGATSSTTKASRVSAT